MSDQRDDRDHRDQRREDETFRPRRYAWRGRVPARALFFASTLPDGPVRALAAWRPGARLRSLDGGLLVVLPSDVHVDARTSAGEVLVDVDGALSAVPLRPSERALVSRGDVVRARGGDVIRSSLVALAEVPAGALVDVSALVVVDAFSLGAPAPVLPPEPPPPRVSERARLLNDDAPNPMRDSVARALRGEASPSDVAAAEAAAAAAAANAEESALRRAQMRAAQGVPSESPGEAMLRALVRALEATGLMDKLKAAQRRYVEDTLDLLKQGTKESLEDALKRAVPLARPGAPTASRPSISLPTSRVGLNISTGPRAPSSSSFTFEGDLYTRMRNSYREAARKLANDKRWREAAFVYIELLGEAREGVAILEKSGERDLIKMAAEIAESHELGADLVVRLYMRARDVPRAVAFARRHRAFSTAVVDLDRSGDRESAMLLREEWAAHLARTGQYSTAVEVLWPYCGAVDGRIDSARPYARDVVHALLDAGINAGGQDVPSLIARRLTLDAHAAHAAHAARASHASDAAHASHASHATTAAAPRDLARFQAIVDDDGPGAAAARAQLAYALGDAPASLRTSTSRLLRALCADAANGASINLKVLAERLADATLRADLPAQPQRAAGGVRRAPSQVLVLSGPAGAASVFDVAPLPDGRLVVALGEAGALVVTRKGGVASRSTEPCERIVMHDAGSRALLVATRGELLRIARYETATGASEHWLDVRAHAIADSTDGDLVFLARNDEVIAIDALTSTSTSRVLWQTRLPVGVEAINIARDAATLAVMWAGQASLLPAANPAQSQSQAPIAVDAEGGRVATFDGRSLSRRDEWQLPVLPDVSALNARGDMLGVDWPEQAVVTPPGAFALQTPPGSNPTSVIALGRDLAAVAFEGDEENGVVAQARGTPPMVLLLDGGATAQCMRASESTLVVVDNRGRAFVVDMTRGELMQRIVVP